MIVSIESMPLMALGDPAGVHARVPRVWCQLDSHLQAQLAQCWAKLVQRMCRPPTEGPGDEYGPDQ